MSNVMKKRYPHLSVSILPKMLARASTVRKYSDEETWSLSHNLSCIEESCIKLTADLFPKLVEEGANPDSLDDLLNDIGEELRHIAYHTSDSRYYSYLGVETPEKKEPTD